MIFREGKKVLRKIWILNISIKKSGKLLVHSAHPVSGIHTIKKIDKNFTYSQQDANVAQFVEKLIKIKKLLMNFCM